MLPAPKPDALSLADVLASCLGAISGESNRLGLAPVERAIVLLIDGLGADALKSRVGHARTLGGALTSKSVIESGFPTTTAAALASLATGLPAGQHGIVGYTALDQANDRIVNQLSGWDDRIDPYTWQLAPTLFEQAVASGYSATAIGPARYSDSGFSHAVLRGATYVAAASIDDRMRRAAQLLREPGPPGLLYVYVPELDQASHAHGWQSLEWTNALETTDSALRGLESALGPQHGLIVTADHGVLDVPARSHVLFDADPALIDGVRFSAGEPRCLQLHFEPDLSPSLQHALVQRWRESEGERAWVVTRDEAIDAGWFGPVRDEVRPRLGDLLVAARKGIAYYDSRASGNARAMIGQHGSWSPAERRIPLLKFGAFSN